MQDDSKLAAPSASGWSEQAEAMLRDGRLREARLCWSRAVWEADSTALPAVLGRWADAETAHSEGSTWREVARALRSHAMSDRLRDRAVRCAGDEQLGSRLQALVASSAPGLTRRALMAAGFAATLRADPVALPASIRHADQHIEPHHTPTLSGELERLLPPLVSCFEFSCDERSIAHQERDRKTKAVKVTPVSPEVRSATLGYVHLLWAWAQARLSEPGLALNHLETGLALIDREDPVHATAVWALRLRVEQALKGLPATEPLPEALRTARIELPSIARYQVDRLISTLRLFSPNPDIANAFDGFAWGRESRRAGANVAWPNEEATRTQAISAMIEDEGPRFAGDLVFWLRAEPADLALSGTRRLLERFGGQPSVLGEVAISACHFDDPDLGNRVLEAARNASPEDCLTVLASAGGHLRRLGLLTEGLHAYQHAARSTASDLDTAVKRVRAGAAFGLDVPEETISEVIAARDPLALEHARDLSSAVSWFAPTMGLRFGSDLLASVSQMNESYSTLHHYSLKTLVFASAIVQSFATDHLALSRVGRARAAVDDAQLRRGPRAWPA